jgi:hypothetical protein
MSQALDDAKKRLEELRKRSRHQEAPPSTSS